MRAADVLPAVAVVLSLAAATIAVFAVRVVLLGRPPGAPSVGRWSVRAFFGAWWRWVRRARPRAVDAPLARVIPIEAARRRRAAR